MKSESFLHTRLSWFAILCVRKITFSLNDFVINYQYLVWNIYDLVDKCDHNTKCLVVKKGKRRCENLLWNKMQMEMKFCVEQKRKKVEKTMLAIYVHGSKLLLFLFYFITRWSWPLYLCFETHIMWYSTWQGWILYVRNDCHTSIKFHSKALIDRAMMHL